MLKLIAPFRAALTLDSSLIAARPSHFTRFLRKVQSELDNPESGLKQKISPVLDIEVNVPADPVESGVSSRYVSLSKNGSFYTLPRVFTLRFKHSGAHEVGEIYSKASASVDEAVARYSKFFSPDMDSLRIDLQDNTIATLSLDLAVDHTHINKQDYLWNRLDEWTTNLIHYLLSELYQRYVFPVLKALQEFSDRGAYRFVQGMSGYTVFTDLIGDTENPYPDLERRCMLMWVNRTLCYSEGYPANQWINSIIRSEGVLKILAAEVHLNAGNSIIILPSDMDKKHLGMLWDVILSAQYYYAAMDVVNGNLIKYIGTTFNRQTSKDLRHLSRDMEAIINKITILQVRYNDFSMELQGVARKIFRILQKEWDFAVLANNVQKKLDLCKSNITVLNQETNNRNQGRTEIVLTSLTGMGILNLFVELGNYATQLPPEHKNMVGDIPGFMDLGFVMSGNALSWVGIVIALAVIVFTVYNRRN